MSAPIPEQLLAPALGHVVELFKLDPTPISAGAAIFYVTPNTSAAAGSAPWSTVSEYALAATAQKIYIPEGERAGISPGQIMSIAMTDGSTWEVVCQETQEGSATAYDTIIPAEPLPSAMSAGAVITSPGTGITRDGQDYYGIPIEGEGFERGGEGAPPQPIVRVSDVARLLAPWVWGAEDMIGAEITRTTVLQSWLDGEPDEDTSAFITEDRYFVEQKTRQGAVGIEWRLRAAVDRSDKKLPGRQALPTCSYRYRVWTGSAWDYSKATCPYVGALMFDHLDASTVTESEDQCSKELTGCKPRFTTVPLPTTAFPGLGRR